MLIHITGVTGRISFHCPSGSIIYGLLNHPVSKLAYWPIVSKDLATPKINLR